MSATSFNVLSHNGRHQQGNHSRNTIFPSIKLNIVYSVGTGIHYISPIGPIRFALGYTLSDKNPSWRVHFSIGADL